MNTKAADARLLDHFARFIVLFTMVEICEVLVPLALGGFLEGFFEDFALALGCLERFVRVFSEFTGLFLTFRCQVFFWELSRNFRWPRNGLCVCACFFFEIRILARHPYYACGNVCELVGNAMSKC